MANSELHLKDSLTNNWRPLTSNDLLDRESFSTEYHHVTVDGALHNSNIGLFAVYLTISGATDGDSVSIKDGSTTVLKFTANGTLSHESFSFCPTTALDLTTGLSISSSLTGAATFSITTVCS